MNPFRICMLISRSIRLTGIERDRRADHDLRGEQPEEQRRLAEPARHRALRADRLGDAVGRRQRDDRGREHRRAEQTDREQRLRARAGDRLQGLGRLRRRRDRLDPP